MYYYRQPRYFDNFKCTGGTCTNSCCVGWRIDWTNNEIDKVKNAPNISPELNALVESSFSAYGDGGVSSMNLHENGRCPFLTEDNFCAIQRELGAEYLSNTCKVYPRLFINADEVVYRFCHMSCPVVMDRMLNDEKSMDLVNREIRENFSQLCVTMNTPESLAQHPEFKYRGELLEFFYEIIADKKRGVETSIILGALAAQQLSKVVESKDYDKIPEAIAKIKPQLRNGAQLRSIENIKPNYHIKLGIAGRFLDQLSPLLKIMIALADNTGHLNIDLYDRGERVLLDEYKDRPFFLRNIALNLLLELALPFKFTEHTILENYAVFAVSFALTKLNAIASVELTERADSGSCSDVNDILLKSAAFVSRALCHSDEKSKALIDVLNRTNMLTPAYLALFVK